MSGLNTGLATNMGMTGAQNVGGVGMYTGSNGPLDTTRFTPQGGQGNVWYQNYFGQQNPNNVSYLQFVDQLGRNALGGASNWGPEGAVAQQQNYLNSPAGQQWLARLRGM